MILKILIATAGITGAAVLGLNAISANVHAPFGEEKIAKKMTATKWKAPEGAKKETALFAAGCFWGVEAAFRKLEGVTATAVGYSGGTKDNPTYKEVCNTNTGHAEAVQVEFDPKKISYEALVRNFFAFHNPTTKNRQGPDFGSQYRSSVFYRNDEQKQLAEKVKAEVNASGKWKDPVVTEITPAQTFWFAEDYHQNYNEKNGILFCPSGIGG